MERDRRTALYAGLWFIGTFVFAIPGGILHLPLVDEPNYVVEAGSDTLVALGSFLEILTGIAGIATAVVLYRILRRASESVALGYVTLRTVEAVIIIVGLISLMAVVTLRQGFAEATGADPALYVTVAKGLVAIHSWTAVLGPAYCAGFGNGILLGYLMFRSGLVPRPWAMFGMAAGTLACASATAVLFGVFERDTVPSAILIFPEIIWEAFLGIYMTFKGFRPSPILTERAVATAQ
jgi:Domain of unknown function (DUF4386)